MSLFTLLEAAVFIESREREVEHGYASTLPMPEEFPHKSSTKRTRKPKIINDRSTHNELEKNRRAHLRSCLEKLKDMVPIGQDGSRHTTLGLLTRAKHFIKNLEDKERKSSAHRDHLYREQRFLRRRLESLGSLSHADQMLKRRSVSESSSLSAGSSVSSSASSESDDVDILGYGSNHSDTDDHSSYVSSVSDGGVAISTRRLTLTDPRKSKAL